MSIRNTYPTIRPSLNLNFARSRTLDPRITFTRTSTGTYMDSDGLIKTAIADQPRFDHRYVNGQIESLGLLVEEQRSNLVKLSNDFSSNFWAGYCGGKSNITYNTTDVISPDGGNNSTKVARGSNGCDGSLSWGFHWNSSTGGIIIDTTNTFTASIYARGAVGGEVINVGFNDSQMTNHTLTTSWQRISRTGIANTTDRGFQVKSDVINQTFYIWGAQLEQGSFPTSYIPTEGSTKTRNQDNTSMTGTNFSDWYNQSEGTVYANTEMVGVQTGRYDRLWAITNSNLNLEGISIFVAGPAGTPSGYVSSVTITNGATEQVGGALIESALTTPKLKSAFAFKQNDCASAYNGQQRFVDSIVDLSSFTTPLDRLLIGQPQRYQGYSCMTVSQLTYYPRRLTNTQLQNLTK